MSEEGAGSVNTLSFREMQIRTEPAWQAADCVTMLISQLR